MILLNIGFCTGVDIALIKTIKTKWKIYIFLQATF